jgi:hypothetical protein
MATLDELHHLNNHYEEIPGETKTTISRQHEIVHRVGALFERADAFDQEVVGPGQRCERLTQEVLGKAFSSKL